MMMTIRVRDFAKYPGGRYRRFGAGSGEEFRENVLQEALASGEPFVEVDLSGVFTYQPSFLDEAFAGLISSGRLSADEFRRKFRFKADRANEPYISMIKRYVEEAAARRSGAPAA